METPMSDTPSDLPYQVCTELLTFIGEQLDNCEETADPWEARYKFDALMPFVVTIREQIETLTDEAERNTCRQQLNAIRNKGKRIAPTIPVVCRRCFDTFRPETHPGGETPQLCEACGQADDPE